MTASRTIVSSALFIVAFSPARAKAADGWGASWSFGPTTSRIVHARTTMVPGRLPPITSNTGPLFLWPGLSNPTSDLIQTTMDAWPDNKGYCGAATGQWCVEASVFGSFGQRNGPTVAIDPDDHVTIDYKLEADGNTWTQTVTSQKLAKVVSTLQSTSGPMPKGGFGFATEADADSYTIDTQYYLCTELDLAEADPHFGATGVGGVGANHGATGTGSGIGTAKSLRTPDGGLTWLVDLITLPAMNPQGTQTPAPAVDCSGGGGAGGSAGNGGSGSAGKGGGAGHGGSTGSGGVSATGGNASTGGSNGSGGKGGSPGNPGSGGRSGSGGAAMAATGGTSGGPVGSGGRASAGSGGVTGSGGLAGGVDATGGTNRGSGGTTAGSGGMSDTAGTGGATGASATGGAAETAADAAGCGCVAGRRSPRGGAALVLLGALALSARRRRSRL